MTSKQKIIKVECFNECSPEYFKDYLHQHRKPVVLKNIDIGDACTKWTPEYLSEAVGNIPVKVHVAPHPTMDFLKKNFLYKTLDFPDFLLRLQKEKQEKDYFVCPEEKYYLRSLGDDPRKDPANITKQYPKLASDIKIPDFFDKDRLFSSVFRISSAGTQVWTHYDVMDNLLIQVIGRKKVVLFPPSDAKFLYMSGDKSLVMDIENPDLQQYPLFINATRYECILEPGDIIFIPALWFHNTIASEYSISVNVFWKNLADNIYDAKDVYGNKDPIVVQRALLSINKALKTLDVLPPDYKSFYIQSLMKQGEKSLKPST